MFLGVLFLVTQRRTLMMMVQGGTSSNTSYYDSNHNHVGHSYEDSYGSGSNFRITLEVADIPTDDDGNPVVDAGDGATHVIVESGSSTWPGMDAGSEETSEYTHYYVAALDDDGNPTGEIDWSAEPSHLGGQDIYNGVTTNWGADWTNEGSKVDASAMAASDDYTAVESTDGHPVFTDAAYSSSETYDWGGSEVTYYADDGSVLGYANVSTWDDGMGGTGTNTGYSDADYNWLGGSWSDSYGSGSNTVEVLTVWTGDGNPAALEIDLDDNADTDEITIDEGVSYRVESGSFKPTGSDTNENEFTFYYAVGGDSDGDFLGGKDTFDFGAQVNIFNPDWNVTTSVDESALLAKLDLGAVDTTGIPQGFLAAILGDNDVDDLQASTEDFEWGGGSETTYVVGTLQMLITSTWLRRDAHL